MKLNKYEKAINNNADWFISKQKEEGYIDVLGDEFYGIKGDASLIGHSVTVRMYAYVLTKKKKYLNSAKKSLDWLAERQDEEGGWKQHAGFTLDAAQCVFEGYNTYYQLSKDKKYAKTLTKAAERMISGTVSEDGTLLLPNIIEIGEYAYFSLLAYETTKDKKFKKAAEQILKHIYANFDQKEGFWNPYDKHKKTPLGAFFLRPVLRASMQILPLKGRVMAKIGGYLLPYVVKKSKPQYSMSLMDCEVLLINPKNKTLKSQTERAIAWAQKHCKGPFPGSLVESKKVKHNVYPVKLINDTKMAALWPSTLLLLAYCGLKNKKYAKPAQETADWILTTQDGHGGFYNFQKKDGSFMKLQSGNVNFYGSLALWHYNKSYVRK